MLNNRFSPDNNSRKSKINFSYYRIYDEKHRLVCGVNKKHICNLDGDIIADFKESVCDENGKNFRIYTSDKFGTFKFDGDEIYSTDEYIGRRERNKLLLFFLIFIAVTGLILMVLTLMKIKTPIEFTQFNINIVDNEGNIILIDKVEIFPEIIYPGKTGSYEFTIENISEYDVWYSASLYEYYNEINVKSFPMEYKLKINDEYADFTASDKELIKLSLENGKIESKSRQKIVIEWEWPFESGNDIYDTNLGYENGQYMILIKIEAGINK